MNSIQQLPRSQTAAATGLMLLLTLGIGSLTGCTKPAATASQVAGKPADPAAEKASAIQRIRDNPNMPPAVKEKVIQQIEGQYNPKAAPGTPPGATATK